MSSLAISRLSRPLLRCRPFPVSRFSTKADQKIALVIGSSGVLGSTVSDFLSNQVGMQVLGADIVASDSVKLDGFVKLPPSCLSAAQLTMELASGVQQLLGDEEELDTIVCASVSSNRS